MPPIIEPKLEILPAAQRQLWPALQPLRDLGYVLYGGTAVALQTGHRQSEDFDFFRYQPLDAAELRSALPELNGATVLQEAPNTLAALVATPSGTVKLSFYGQIRIGRIDPPSVTLDEVCLIASINDLLATKLKAILDRAEAKDYVDIAEMLRSGLSLPAALAAFRAMYGGEPATVLRAIAFFEDGDVNRISDADKLLLREARDAVRELPDVQVASPYLAR